MRNEFSKVFIKLTEKLDFYFHGKLTLAKIRCDIEKQKEDLIQDTALEVLLKLNNEKYNDYNLIALVWTKAEDVWHKFINNAIKKQVSTIPLDWLTEDKPGPDPENEKDQVEFVRILEESMDKELWNIMLMRSDGFKFKEIALHLKKNENAIKTKMSRMRISVINKWKQ